MVDIRNSQAHPSPVGHGAIANAIFPDGSNGEFGLPSDIASVIEKSKGCRLWDVDGKEYIDCSLAFGAVLLGHANKQINKSIRKELEAGENYGGINTQLIRLGERLTGILPCAEKLRFCTSGTEAMMYCIKLARAWTGRQLLVKFEGAYHGATDIGCASLDTSRPDILPAPRGLDAGCTATLESELLVAPFNDAGYVEELFKNHGSDIAGILVEPLHRCIPPEQGFLEALRDITNNYGSLLIYDEVVTGFRLALGGAQEKFGVVPDLAGYGKGLGNGYPIAIVCGRKEIMDLLGESRFGGDNYVWSVSTGGGNTISAAAANAALDQYQEPDFYTNIYRTADYLRKGISSIFIKSGIPSQVIGCGPLLQIILHDRPIANSRDLLHERSSQEHSLMIEFYKKGIYVNPMGTKIYISSVHSESDCDDIIDITENIVQKVLV